MSWKDKVENIELSITTGDGKVWKPLWRKANKDVEYNTSGFEAIDIEGTYVNRKKKKGDKYPITLYFTGEDCVDDAKLFEISARDARPWIYKHPYLDAVTVQPVKLRFDYSQHNVVVITGILLETITRKYPQEISQPKNTVEVKSIEATATLSEVFTEEITTPLPGNIELNQTFVDRFNNIWESVAQAQANLAILKELATTASSAVQNVISDVTSFIDGIINLINFPIILVQDIEFKISAMVESIQLLETIFINVADTTISADVQTKNNIFYEFLASKSMVAMGDMLISSEYNDSDQVLRAIDSYKDISDEVLLNFEDNDYNQNPQIALDLDIMVNVTIANLYDIAFNTRNIRLVILPKDTNIIILAHKYYGAGDADLDEFILQNNITGGEYLQIKSGREIKYYSK